MPFRGKLILRGGEAIHDPAARALGGALPSTMRTATAGETELLWLGPDEWLVLTPPERAEAAAAALRDALAGLHHAVVVVSDRMTGIRLAGGRAADVLNAGCPLDLHRSAFPPGAVTRTVLAKAPVDSAAPR